MSSALAANHEGFYFNSTLEKNSMNTHNKLLGLTVMLISALSISACGKTEDKTATPGAATPGAETTVGTVIDDSVITTKVKAALLADEIVKGFDIQVETRKGEVQLSGFVDSQLQIDRATTVARSVEGVKNVINNMTLKAATGAMADDKIDDGMITTKVKAALLADESIKSTDIAVVTRNGEVQLSGFVNNQTQIERATEVTRQVEGVRNVINEMAIKK